jgi:O-antigen/teichoic acid export membrane protein
MVLVSGAPSAESQSALDPNPARLAKAPLARVPAVRRLAAEFSWVMCGKFAMIGANAVLVLLLAERLDLVTCGQFVTMIAGQLLLSRVLMPGIGSGVTRLRTLASYQARQHELVRAGLRVIWWLSAAAALIGVVTCAAWVLLHEPHWKLWLTAAIVAGGTATALVDYCYAIHLAHLRYRQAAAAQGGTAVLRLFVIAPVPILWPQQAWLVFLLYPFATLLSGLLQMKLLRLRRGGMNDLGLIGDLLRYSSWQGVTNVAAVLSLYQGTFVLNLYGQHVETALFGLALMLSQGFFAVNNAYTEYLLPRASRLRHSGELRPFMRHAFIVVGLFILGGIPVTLALGVMTRLLRPELHPVEPIFYFLAAAMLLSILQAPLSAAFHYLLRPHLLMIGWVLLVLCTGGLSLILAKTYGAWGAAVGQLGGTALALLALAAMLQMAWAAQRRGDVVRVTSTDKLSRM